MNSPPERKSRQPGKLAAPSTAADVEQTTPLRRRRAASQRLPVLPCGRSDPWHYDPPTSPGYADAAHHLLGHGLLPAPNREGLHLMWRRGGHARRAAELIAERWELVG